LLVHGANLSLKNKNGDTAFHLAAEKGHTEIIKALLRIKDIQTDMRNNAGDTPFQLALNMKRIDCLNLLRDAATN
jgi:ankyrin repeat protein